jgi:anti-sigma factor ChrR (cupin superfamily)
MPPPVWVKLSQFEADDQDYVRLDTNNTDWLPGQIDGLHVMPLHDFGGELVALVKWAPGTKYVSHGHPHGEEIYVLSGVFSDEHGTYPAGTWIRNPPGSQHTPFSDEGCVIYVKTGHL